MKWNVTDAKPGDMIRVRLGSCYHYGIFVSEQEVIQFGMPPIAEYAALPEQVRVLATDIDVFACGKIIEVASWSFSEKRKKRSAEDTVQQAKSRIGEGGYSLLHNNCEHFVYECMFGIHYCSQVDEVRKKWLARSEDK